MAMSRVITTVSAKTPQVKDNSSVASGKARASSGLNLSAEKSHDFKISLDEFSGIKKTYTSRKGEKKASGVSALSSHKGAANAGKSKKGIVVAQEDRGQRVSKKTVHKKNIKSVSTKKTAEGRRHKGKTKPLLKGKAVTSDKGGGTLLTAEVLKTTQGHVEGKAPARGGALKNSEISPEVFIEGSKVKGYSFGKEADSEVGQSFQGITKSAVKKKGLLKGAKKGRIQKAGAVFSEKRLTSSVKGLKSAKSGQTSVEAGSSAHLKKRAFKVMPVSARHTLSELSGPGVLELSGVEKKRVIHKVSAAEVEKGLKNINIKKRVKAGRGVRAHGLAVSKRSFHVKDELRKKGKRPQLSEASTKGAASLSKMPFSNGALRSEIHGAGLLRSGFIPNSAGEGVNTVQAGFVNDVPLINESSADRSAPVAYSAVLNTAVLKEKGIFAAAALSGRGDLAGSAGMKVIKRAADGIVMSLRESRREVVITLEPEELGKMEIKVRLSDGLVETSILVDNPRVMAMINADEQALKEQLARHGIMAGGLEVALNKKGHGFSGQRQESFYSKDNPLAARRGLIKGSVAEALPAAHSETSSGRGLDLFI